MKYLEIAFMILLVMAAVYTIFNLGDFITSWYKWTIAVAKGMGKIIVWLWEKIINIFKKG